ncbi:hypothetical protein GGC65_001679 [Sphingopyxis sp. OAS728]|uniref:hypothetical protein n=1 Tax=Sphingopyxis sp. OAS728 TaxID=2663823 RepID=UPI00178A2443|nr:hypothetical protein [Sphingopyxis sp. OAS728]MBE1527223.1 hypothetical protein [Sphingopyxis sp. OAS728]
MDRRTLLASIGAAAAGSACSAKDDSGAEKAGRPTLAIDSDRAGHWRIRSWQWRDNAWRPLIARAKQTEAGIVISGTISAADRAEVAARLRT